MNPDEATRRLLRELPDEARWIEARALLLSRHARVFLGEAGSVVRNEVPASGLAVVLGEPEAGLLETALVEQVSEVLCAPESAAYLGEVLGGWSQEGARLYALGDPSSLASKCGSVRELRVTDSLAHLPRELREELVRARAEREIFTAFAGTVPASFAYAYWRTETLFDISIDTAPEYRRRGLARLAVSMLIRRELARGLRPVWGALETNAASRALATSLGFEPCDEVVLFSRP